MSLRIFQNKADAFCTLEWLIKGFPTNLTKGFRYVLDIGIVHVTNPSFNLQHTNEYGADKYQT